MNKKRWVYVGEGGRRTTIGMIHNTSKGQFMIYSGKKIVLVEFKVYNTRNFSFFLDDELCEVKVIKTPEGFDYEFGINTDAETPLNEERKAIIKNERKQSIVAIVGLLALVAVLIGGGLFVHRYYLKQERINNGAYSTGVIHITRMPKSYSLSYSFGTTYRTYSHQIEYYRSPNPLAPNGFPLYDNDEFYVQYARKDPENNAILFDRPSEKQLATYKQRTFNIHANLHPEQDSTYCACLLDAVFEIDELNGYGHFYYQNTPPSKNKRFNIKTYNEFILKEDFIKAREKCENPN